MRGAENDSCAANNCGETGARPMASRKKGEVLVIQDDAAESAEASGNSATDLQKSFEAFRRAGRAALRHVLPL